MKTSDELREERAALLDECDSITKRDGETRDDLTEDEKSTLDAKLAEIDKLNEDLATRTQDEEREARLEQARKEASKWQPRVQLPQPGDNPYKRDKHPAIPVAGRTVHFDDMTIDGRTIPGREVAYRAGKWLHGYLFGNMEARRWCEDYGVINREHRAMGVSVNTAGGYLAPEEFESTVIKLREGRGVFRQYARVVQMGSDGMTIPIWSSGPTAYAIGENTTITASDEAWKNVLLTPKKWAVLVRMSSELLEDSAINLADQLSEDIAYAFADKEDDCGFNGTGAATYHGIYGLPKIFDGNHGAGLTTSGANDDTFPELTLADEFEPCVGTLPVFANANARWFISRYGWATSMANLADAAGGNTTETLAAGPSQQMFLGYPITFTQVMPGSGDQSGNLAAVLGDLRMGAVLGERRGLVLKTSEHRYMDVDQWAIQGTTRFDIQIHSLGDGTNAGPIVAIRFNAS